MRRIGSMAQRLAEKPYEKRVRRSENYPGCLDLDDHYVGPSCEEYVALMDQVGLEVQIVSIEHNRGTPRWASQMLPPHPYLDRDRPAQVPGTGP